MSNQFLQQLKPQKYIGSFLLAKVESFTNNSISYFLIMQFAHPERIKALYERGFYKELEVFHKILRRFLNTCIHCDFTKLDELTA